MYRVFVSYRRRLSSSAARLLASHLQDHFGKHAIFFDQDSISPGQLFPHKIEAALSTCKVFLIVISKGWETESDSNGLRIHDPNDWVRREIVTVLKRNAERIREAMLEPVLVIPLLVDRSDIPRTDSVPADLKEA